MASAQPAPDPESAPPPVAVGRPEPRAPRSPKTFAPVPIAAGVAGAGLNVEVSRFGGGAGDSTFIPPDTMGAVGPNHIVELINGNMEIFNKATGASLEDRSLFSFWVTRVGLTITSNRLFDPRVVYDPASQRWFAVAIDDPVDADDNGVNEQANSIYVARSDSSDPTGDWDGFAFDSDTTGVEEFHDYPTLGLDADGVYICTQDFDGPGNESCYSLPKADLLLAAPSVANLTRFEATPAGLPAVAGAWQPALDFGPSDGRAALLGTTGTALRRTSILGAGGAGATLTAAVPIAGDPGHAAPPNARQPTDDVGETNLIENVAPRFVGNVFELGNSLWAVHSVLGTGGNAALRWYEINETTNTVIQTGLINDTTRDFIDPSIAVNAHGDVVIGYTCSGPALAASACASLGETAAGVTTFQAPSVLFTGAGDYYRDSCTPPGCAERNRWGDYSATVIDPAKPCTFWTFQEYTAVAATGDVGPGENESGVWGVRAVEMTFQQCQIDAGVRDFGDAPDSYGTLLASNGARHTQIFSAPVLGADIDVEANGLPTANLTGDDTNGIDDEDGVAMPPGLIAGISNTVSVTASAAGGRLDAFVDFNNNGNFSDPGEKIANSVPLAAGTNNVTFSVPLNAAVGTTAARFRISTAGGLGPIGLAANGEVEDHTATVLTPEAACENPPPPGAIVGDAGNNVLIGTPGNDVIFGLGGHDDIRGMGGSDLLCGNDGVDWLQGGDGNDALVGGEGTDLHQGGAGDDAMSGGPGTDRLDGGDGNDTLSGGPGTDRLDGGDGNDTLSGGPGTDQLDGNAGTNSNDGGPDIDRCFNPAAAPGCEL